MKVFVPYRPIYIAQFLLLAFLCYQGHQLVRHLVGAALCGGLGSMTFTVATTRQPCVFPTVETLAGPLFTYGLAYVGMLLLHSRRYGLFAYALIFASFTPLRWIQTLSGRGDELVLAQQWFGTSSRLVIAAIVLLIGVPPVVAAFRAIANQHRTRVLLGSLLLPLPLLFAMLFGNRALFGDDGIPEGQTLIFGIAPIVLIVDVLAIGLLLVLWRSRAGRENVSSRPEAENRRTKEPENRRS